MKKGNTSGHLKYSYALKSLSLSLILTVLIVTSCSDDDTNAGVDKAPCTLTKETTTTKGKDGALTYTMVYTILHGNGS